MGVSVREMGVEGQRLIDEAQHGEVLLEEARREGPPGIPDLVLDRRREAAQCVFTEPRMVLLGDDDRVRHEARTALDRADGRLGVEKYGCHQRDVELPESIGKIVGRAVVDLRARLELLVREPEAVSDVGDVLLEVRDPPAYPVQ